MLNPMLKQLGGNRQEANGLNMMQAISIIKQMLTGSSPQAVFNMMLQTNPKFADFVQRNKGKSVEQMAADMGIDINTLQSLFD